MIRKIMRLLGCFSIIFITQIFVLVISFLLIRSSRSYWGGLLFIASSAVGVIVTAIIVDSSWRKYGKKFVVQKDSQELTNKTTFLIVVGLTFLYGFYQFLPSPTQLKLSLDLLPAFFIYSIVNIFLTPIWEEFFFRGVLLDSLANSSQDGLSIIVSAFLFAVTHVVTSHQIRLSTPLFVQTFLFGILVGAVYLKTCSLKSCIFIHMVNNFFVFLITYRDFF